MVTHLSHNGNNYDLRLSRNQNEIFPKRTWFDQKITKQIDINVFQRTSMINPFDFDSVTTWCIQRSHLIVRSRRPCSCSVNLSIQKVIWGPLTTSKQVKSSRNQWIGPEKKLRVMRKGGRGWQKIIVAIESSYPVMGKKCKNRVCKRLER